MKIADFSQRLSVTVSKQTLQPCYWCKLISIFAMPETDAKMSKLQNC